MYILLLFYIGGVLPTQVKYVYVFTYNHIYGTIDYNVHSKTLSY